MKLDTEKKVLLAQKSLYTKQLVHYRHLCDVYKKLANILVKNNRLKDLPEATIADQVQRYYGEYLAMAAKGDLSFIQHNGISKDGFIAQRFSQEQLALFEDYARYSERVDRFQYASGLLQDATYHQDSFDISQELMDEFEEFMQSDHETASFRRFLEENPKRWIGHISYINAVNEINRIKKIDPNHLAVLSKRSITPQSFGATITGARGRISPVQEKISSQFKSAYTKKEHEEYSKDVSFSEKLGASAYKVGYHAKEAAKQFYTAHKGTIQKALKKAAILAVSLGMVVAASKGIGAIRDAHEFNSQVYMGNPAYEQTVSDSTVQMMQDVDKLLTSLETSSSIPTADQLREITTLVDNEGNAIMDNLIRTSFNNQFENLTIPEGGVVIQYNKNYDNLSDGSVGNFVYINCKDGNGKEYKYTIRDFRSQGENRIQRLFDDERNIDEHAEGINDVYSEDFTVNSKNAQKYLAVLRDMHNNNVELAGSLIVIDSPQIDYDNAKVTDSETLKDRLNLDMAKIFAINPKLKTVTPEKVPETTKVVSDTNSNEAEITDDSDER